MLLTLKSKNLEDQVVAKRSKYTDGVGAKTGKLSSVKKVIMIGLVPNVQENYENVKTILTTIDLSGLPISFSCDIKFEHQCEEIFLVLTLNTFPLSVCLRGIFSWTVVH